MNEKTGQDTETEPATEEPSPPSPEKAVEKQPWLYGPLASGLALAVSLIALVVAGMLWYRYYEKRELFQADILGRLEQSDAVTEKTLDDITAVEQRLDSFKTTQNTLVSAIEKMQREFSGDRSEWALSETEQLLIIANHRLQLARDIDTTITALRTADQQLVALADPKLLPVRKAITEEIAALGSLERIDVPGIALRLGNLAETIADLPITLREERKNVQSGAEPQNGEGAGEQQPGFARQLWNDIRSHMRIRSDVENYKPLLPPDQSYFLRENLRLLLYGAQMALLVSDTATYQQNLDTARTWIKQYFDTNSQAVSRILEELDRLHATAITVALPDISASLETLRQIMRGDSGP